MKVIIVFLICVIFISFSIDVQKGVTNNIKNYEEISLQDKINECKKLPLSDICLFKIAINSQDISICQMMKDTIYIWNCQSEVITLTKNFKNCEIIETEQSKNSCLIEYAKYSLNESICDRINEDLSKLSEHELKNIDANVSQKIDCKKWVDIAKYYNNQKN